MSGCRPGYLFDGPLRGRGLLHWSEHCLDRMLVCLLLGRPGSDLLSHVLGRSTIGAEGFHGRVRDGIGCLAPRNDHQVIEEEDAVYLMLGPSSER